MSQKPNLQQRRLEMILETYRDREPRPGTELRQFMRLWREYIYPHRLRLMYAMFMNTINSLMVFVYQYIASQMVDWVLNGGKGIPKEQIQEHIRRLGIIFFCNAFSHFPEVLAAWQARYSITKIGQNIVFELRRHLHERLQRLPLSFFDRTQTGRLLSIVLDDVGTIQGSIGGIVVNFTQFTLQVLIGITILVSLNAKMGILALIAIPLYVVNFRYFRPKIREGNITARRANTAIYNRVEERISAIKTVKVFGREMAEVRNFAVAANNLARLTMYILRNQSWQTVFATAISGITTGLIMYLGMKSLQDGSMTMGRVMWFYSCAVNLFAPAVALSDLVAMEMPRINVVMRRVFDLLEAEPETADRPNAISLANANGDVTFKDVSFTYPGDEESTLHNVSFSVPSGAQIAVMGPSGAGKSSLLYLLMRFYDPDSGTIELDGHDLRDLTLLSMRDRVTLVMQEPVIFSGTVSENIRYGRLDASDNDVITAAKNADLHNFINTLPDRYDTIVGERGMALSGGQRQRLALAASLISRPSVLLLDDTTSALDPVTEARVRVTLNKLMKGKTCFVVTHRISTAMTSDYILVLENGTVSQFGTPNQLLQDEGLVKRIFEQQSGEGAGE